MTGHPHSPRVIAHRGASGYALENTLAAFREAARRGADGVELDVHATADGAILVHHDPAVPGIGLIAEHPAERFRPHRLPNGEPIPTLEMALSSLDGLEAWVEVKQLDPRWDGALLQTLSASHSPSRCAVHSFDHRIIARLGEQAPALRRGVLLSSYLMDPVAAVHAADSETLWMATDFIDAELVGAMNTAGIEVIAWTVNTDEEVRRLAALGVQGICGNFPDRIRAALAGHS